MALFTDDIAPTDAVALNVEPSVGNVLREHLQAALRCRMCDVRQHLLSIRLIRQPQNASFSGEHSLPVAYVFSDTSTNFIVTM
jgi:hypothetical protein